MKRLLRDDYKSALSNIDNNTTKVHVNVGQSDYKTNDYNKRRNVPRSTSGFLTPGSTDLHLVGPPKIFSCKVLYIWVCRGKTGIRCNKK